MKKLLVPFLILSAVLTFAKLGFALTAPATVTPGEKQLIADGDMEATNAAVGGSDWDMEAANTAAWTSGASGATLSKVAGSLSGTGTRKLRVTNTGVGGFAYQSVLTINHVYRIRGWAAGDGGTGIPSLRVGGGGTFWTGTNSTSPQYFDVTVMADSASTPLLNNTGGAGTYADFDDVLVVDATAGSWTATSATLSKQTTSPHGGQQVLRVAYSSAATGNAAQVVMTVGKTYHVTGWARGDGTSNPCVGDNTCRWNGASSASWQRFDVTYATARTDVRLYGQILSAGHYVEFDDVMVTEYKGFVQVRDSQIITDGDMEMSGTTNYTAGNNADLSKVTSSHGGKYALRVAYNGTDNPIAIPTAVPQEGKRYHLTGWARGDGSVYPVIKNGNTTNAWTGTTSNTWQRIDIIYTQGVGNYYYFRMIGSSGYVEFDDMMSTEYKGEADVIDKQMLLDGDMESSSAASWSASASTLTKETSSPKAGSKNIKILANGTQNYAYAIQNVLTIGKKYRVSGWARSDGTNAPRVYFGGNYQAWAGTNSTSWQRVDGVGQAVGNGYLYLGESGASSGYTEFDDIFVTAEP